MKADHELFIYVLSGELQAQCGTAGKLIKAGDIIHAPRGDNYRLQVKSPFARYVMVRSTSYLEHRIESMTPEEAEQARVNVRAN
jgi:quercetin dioxygenase-like cupin family protein